MNIAKRVLIDYSKTTVFQVHSFSEKNNKHENNKKCLRIYTDTCAAKNNFD